MFRTSLLCLALLACDSSSQPHPLPDSSLLDSSSETSDVSSLKILAVGDSITMGSPEFIGGYRLRLGQKLDFHGVSYEFVGRLSDPGGLHEGYSGYTIAEIRTVALQAVALFQPDVVLIVAGTNNYPKEDYVDDYVAACNDIAALGPVVIAGSIPPRGDGPNIVPTQDYNAALPAAFAADGDPTVHFWDVCRLLTYPSDMADEAHPNDQGYTKMATEWVAALFAYLDPSVTATRESIRDRMIYLLQALTPEFESTVKFSKERGELPFEGWAEANPLAAFRRFDIQFTAPIPPPVVSGGDVEYIEDDRLELRVAYPKTYARYGADNNRDMMDIIDQDSRLINGNDGIGINNTQSSYCCVRLDSHIDGADDPDSPVAYLVNEYRLDYFQPVSGDPVSLDSTSAGAHFGDDFNRSSAVGTLGWVSTSSGANSGTTHSDTTDGASGVRILSTGGDAGGWTNYHLGTSAGATGWQAGAGPMIWEGRVKIPTLSTAGAEFMVGCGLTTTSTTSSNTPSVTFAYDLPNELSGNWLVKLGSGSFTNTSVAVTTDWTLLRIQTTADGLTHKFYINDALVATLVDPTHGTGLTAAEHIPIFRIATYGAGNVNRLYVDRMTVQIS